MFENSNYWYEATKPYLNADLVSYRAKLNHYCNSHISKNITKGQYKLILQHYSNNVVRDINSMLIKAVDDICFNSDASDSIVFVLNKTDFLTEDWSQLMFDKLVDLIIFDFKLKGYEVWVRDCITWIRDDIRGDNCSQSYEITILWNGE